MRFEVAKVSMGADPQDLLRGYQGEGRPLTLVARVTGKVGTAFPDGPPVVESEAKAPDEEPSETAPAAEGDAEEEREPAIHLTESKGSVNIIVIADSDLLNDRFWVQTQDVLGTRIAIPTAANGPLVVNALDNLTGSSDLINVRNRGSSIRPFDRIADLRHEAELRYREKEEELIARLERAERNLVALQERKQGGDSVILSDAQRREMLGFRQERLKIRKELRQVRRELRRSIEKLEASIKLANIGLMPILIAVFGLIAGVWQVRRRGAIHHAPG